jgi:RNA polymerase sigma-70 factor, ECF subfamily
MVSIGVRVMIFCGIISYMQSLPNEQQLVTQAQQGSKEAVSALYEFYAQPIFRYISYRVESDMIAEDLAADVFLRMVQKLRQYRYTGAPFGAWLFRIAATRIADYYRQRNRSKAEAIQETHPSDDTDPFGKIEKREERDHLRQALRSLPEDYQTLLILRFMQQLPHQEVAAVLNKSEASIRVMQHRALKALAKALGNDEKVRSYLRGGESS